MRGSSSHVMFSRLSAGDQEFVSRVKVRSKLIKVSKKIFDTSQQDYLMTQHTLQWPLAKLKAKNCAQEIRVQKYLGDEKESSGGRMRTFNLSEILVSPKP